MKDNFNSSDRTPKVSIIVPCYNEEDTISLLLNALYDQDYPKDKMEVIIADGMSSDRTRQNIEQSKQFYADLKIDIVDNYKRKIPAGLNRAIEYASGEYLIRIDAHAIPATNYVSKCVIALNNNLGANVGGIWEIKPGKDNWIGRSIALAASHPLGAGDALYRLGGYAQSVDTVPFGAFRRTLFEEVGLYDESLETNEDYEFNTRIRRSGGIIWFDPAIKCTYFARPTFQDLARQYWRYGYWKTRMLRKYPSTLRWRQLLPPIFILSLILFATLAVFYSFARVILMFEIGVYGLCLVFGGLHLAYKNRSLLLLIGIPLALFIMHFTWGSSFLWGVLNLNRSNVHSS